jgi:hypothetical protein
LSKPAIDKEKLKVYENVKSVLELKDCTFRPKVNKAQSTFRSKRMSRSQGDLYQDDRVLDSRDLFNKSDKDQKPRPSPVSSKRFQRLFDGYKTKKEKMEKLRQEDRIKKENEFDFKPKLSTRKVPGDHRASVMKILSKNRANVSPTKAANQTVIIGQPELEDFETERVKFNESQNLKYSVLDKFKTTIEKHGKETNYKSLFKPN